MRTLLTKTALTATLGLAITFTLSCSDDKDDNNPVPPPTVSSSSGGGSSSSVPSSSSGGIIEPPSHTHVWGEWAVTAAPTCEAAGVETRTCTLDQSHTEPRAAAQLAWGEWTITTPATPTAVGEETRACPGGASPSQTRPLYPKCGNDDYDPATKFCQDVTNAVKDLCGTATYTATEGCCGSSKYAFATHFCDSRDSKIYKFVSIGDGATAQTWMAENLNHDTETDGSKCYGNDDVNCVKYGRLYNWATAMAGSASSAENPSGVRGVCPEGWHLPSQAEWDALTTYIEENKGCTSCDAKHLKATSGWNSDLNGKDTYGFSALPGGSGSSGGYFGSAGSRGYWWSASEYSSAIYAYTRNMDYNYESAYWDVNDKDFLFSVRCLQD